MTASERSERRTALHDALRNWNLNTGYTLDITFEQEITVRLLHNWIYFADLWQNELSDPQPLSKNP